MTNIIRLVFISLCLGGAAFASVSGAKVSRPVFYLDANQLHKSTAHGAPLWLQWNDLIAPVLTGQLEGSFPEVTSTPWQLDCKTCSRSLRFNGVDQWVNFTDHPKTKMSSAFSVEIWFRPSGNGGSPNGGILVNREGEYELAISGSSVSEGTIWFAVGNSVPGWRVTSTGVQAKMNSWQQAVLTFDSESQAEENINFYYNGRKAFQTKGVGGLDLDHHLDLNDFRVGGRQLTEVEQYYQGDIAVVALYANALTGSQVKANCEFYRRRFTEVSCK